MKKRTIGLVTASSLVAGAAVAGALFIPSCNQPVAVYGPPDPEPVYDPANNENEDVYGPPEYFDDNDSADIVDEAEHESSDASEDEAETADKANADHTSASSGVVTTGQTSYTSSSAQSAYADEADIQSVDYEPAKDPEQTIPSSAEAANAAGPGFFVVDENENVCVYGPPEWFEPGYDPTNNQNVDVYGPPDYYDDSDKPEFIASSNENVCVYGPPEWFEQHGGNTDKPDQGGTSESESETSEPSEGADEQR